MRYLSHLLSTLNERWLDYINNITDPGESTQKSSFYVLNILRSKKQSTAFPKTTSSSTFIITTLAQAHNCGRASLHKCDLIRSILSRVRKVRNNCRVINKLRYTMLFWIRKEHLSFERSKKHKLKAKVKLKKIKECTFCDVNCLNTEHWEFICKHFGIAWNLIIP